MRQNNDTLSLTDGEDDNDIGDPLPKVTNHQAYTAFQDVQAHLLCNGSDADQSNRILSDLEIDLTKVTSKTYKQCLITDFLVMCNTIHAQRCVAIYH